MREEDSVLAANCAFYDAFQRHDADAMAAIWAREHLVACIHPGWDALHGRDRVLSSWRAILDGGDPPEISFKEPRVIVVGDTAFLTCVELVMGNELIVTNVFTRERGDWRIVHHHAGPFARGLDPAGADNDLLN